eukprot:3180156-Rhodomonas_salina.5
MFGTDLPYVAIVTDLSYAATGTDPPYAATRETLQAAPPRPYPVRFPICLCARYAMPGTDVVYGATCCATFSTDRGYAAICLRACCAMPGTEIAYGSSSHGISGTEKAHAGTRSTPHV